MYILTFNTKTKEFSVVKTTTEDSSAGYTSKAEAEAEAAKVQQIQVDVERELLRSAELNKD